MNILLHYYLIFLRAAHRVASLRVVSPPPRSSAADKQIPPDCESPSLVFRPPAGESSSEVLPRHRLSLHSPTQMARDTLWGGSLTLDRGLYSLHAADRRKGTHGAGGHRYKRRPLRTTHQPAAQAPSADPTLAI